MKKSCLYFISFVIITLLFTSCGENSPEREEDLLIGKWQQVNTQLYYKYLADYTGATWDEAEDVREDEAQVFEWKLERSDLTQIHLVKQLYGEISKVPKYYTITELTGTTLKYKDDLTGRIDSFVKVE